MSFQEVADQAAAYALRIMELERELGECSGALASVGHPIEWRARIDAAVVYERERIAAACWERRGHFASDNAARAFADLVRSGAA